MRQLPCPTRLTDASCAAMRRLRSGRGSRFRLGHGGALLCRLFRNLLPAHLTLPVPHASDALAPVLYAQAKADPDAIFQNPSKTCR